MRNGSILPKLSRSDAYSGAGTGQSLDVSLFPCSSFGIQVRPGTATTWSVVVEGSLDGINFDTLLTHTNGAPGANSTLWSGAQRSPCLYFRSRAIAANGTISAIIIGMP